MSCSGHRDGKERIIQETLKREKAQTWGLLHVVSEKEMGGVSKITQKQ